MSFCLFLASNAPLEALENPHHKTFSINEAKALGILSQHNPLLSDAIDPDKPDVISYWDYEVTYQNGCCDGDADDNFGLYPIIPVEEVHQYTEKNYAVSVEWHYGTVGRAERILAYIKKAMEHTDSIELWSVWLSDGEDLDIKRKTLPLSSLKAEDILSLASADFRYHPETGFLPAYCIIVKK